MTSDSILEKHKQKLIKEIEGNCSYFEENGYFEKYVAHELIDLNCGYDWKKSLIGCASALEYVCKLLANRGC